LDKNDRFEDFLADNLLETNIINSKKTTINLYQYENFKWLEKIVKLDWKRDDLHQIFVSYFYMNQLRTICPNFIHTYYHKQEENQTRLFMEYVDTITLDKKLREQGFTTSNQKVKKDFRLLDLINIWVNVCCALQIAQDYCGFVHMDLYPWNILIKDSLKPISYKTLGIETNFRYNPILIDYGNCHVVHDGFHYYNTTPFQLSSFSDVMCLIITSLDVFLSKVTLNDQDRKLLIKIVDFILSFDIFEDYDLKNIRDIKNFLKENKKFSKMLSNINCFSNKRPIDFVHYLYEKKCLDKSQIHFSKNKSLLNMYPLSIQNLQDQVHFFGEILANPQKYRYPVDDIFLLSRRIVTTLKSVMNSTKFSHNFEKEYYNNVICLFIEKFKRYIYHVQKTQKRKIWNGLNSSIILDEIMLEYKPDENAKSFCIETLTNLALPEPKVPLLKTHLCKYCQDGKSTMKEDYFHLIKLVQFTKEDFNMFILKNQTI